MASAIMSFARQLDAYLILAKGTQGDITKMDPDMTFEIPLYSFLPSISSDYRFLEAGEAVSGHLWCFLKEDQGLNI